MNLAKIGELKKCHWLEVRTGWQLDAVTGTHWGRIMDESMRGLALHPSATDQQIVCLDFEIRGFVRWADGTKRMTEAMGLQMVVLENPYCATRQVVIVGPRWTTFVLHSPDTTETAITSKRTVEIAAEVRQREVCATSGVLE